MIINRRPSPSGASWSESSSAPNSLDTSAAEQIWGESYKRDQTAVGLIAIQEKIGKSVIGAIADQFGLIQRRLSSESRKKAPADLKAYDTMPVLTSK